MGGVPSPPLMWWHPSCPPTLLQHVGASGAWLGWGEEFLVPPGRGDVVVVVCWRLYNLASASGVEAVQREVVLSPCWENSAMGTDR